MRGIAARFRGFTCFHGPWNRPAGIGGVGIRNLSMPNANNNLLAMRQKMKNAFSAAVLGQN